jgi:hypothetical protein
MARSKKPTDPAKALEQAEARRVVESEKRRLQAMGATYTLDRAGRIISSYRSNVFNLLLQRGTITPNHHDAAYTLAKDWAAWKGLDGKPETFGEIVDGGLGAAELITDRMIKAGRRIYGDPERNRVGALEGLDQISRTLLEHLMVATVEEDRPMAWRGIAERIGIKVRERQTQAVVIALEGLRAFYEEPGRVAA